MILFKFFLIWFLGTFCFKIYIRKYLNEFSSENYTWRLAIFQNVLISCILLISRDKIVSILFVNNNYIGNIRIFWRTKLYIKTWCSSKSLRILTIFRTNFWTQNVLIFPSCKIPQGEKCPNTPKLYTTSIQKYWLNWLQVSKVCEQRYMSRILVTLKDSLLFPKKGILKYLVTNCATWHTVSNADTAQLEVDYHL